MTRQPPFLAEPQWHQEQSPCLCPLWLQEPSCLPFSFSWRSFTMSRPLQPGIRLLRRLCHPSHTLTFLRPLPRQGGVGLPKFRDVRRIEVPLGACYRPGASGITYRYSSTIGTKHHPFLGQVCQPLSPVRIHDLSHADFSRHHRNQVWSVNCLVAASRRTFVTGLPTLTSATRERRPARPYTVIHV